MRFIPPDFNVLAIDPGANMGIAVVTISMADKRMYVKDSFTLTMDEATRANLIHREEVLTRRHSIKDYLQHKLTRLLDRYDIDHVIYEAAYNSRSLVAYDSLVFYGNTISDVCHYYDFDLTYESITPSQVKTNIGVKGNSGDKEAIRKAVVRCADIELPQWLHLEDLTEHAVDAIAIAYVAYQQCLRSLKGVV